MHTRSASDLQSTACAAAIEDSHNDVLSARAAGMDVTLMPNSAFLPGKEAMAMALAREILGDLGELTVDLIEGWASSHGPEIGNRPDCSQLELR